MSKGAIYHHFKSKEEIFIAVMNKMTEESNKKLFEIRNDPNLTGKEKLKKLLQDSVNVPAQFALPLYLLRETDSSALFGAVTACAFIPMVIFSLFGGVIADRKNKRNIMVALDFTTAAVVLGFSVALGNVSLVPLMIAVLMILYGISGIYQPAVQASIPLIAEKQVLMQGNAVINMVSTLAGLLGPIIGSAFHGDFCF